MAAGVDTKLAWVLNLDAELELEARGGYTPSEATQRMVRDKASQVVGLVRARDHVLSPDTEALGAGWIGQCWCPTPAARAQLARAGARVPNAPSKEILRKVNHRGFALPLVTDFPHALLADSIPAIAQHLSSAGEGTTWLAKRALGFAGRGHRRLGPTLSEVDENWCKKALRDSGGLVVEPLVTRDADFVQHGLVSPEGQVTLGEPVRQRCDDVGHWLSSALATSAELGNEERQRLRHAAKVAAEALHVGGYYGPFGIDAFRYLMPSGKLAFRALVELNARYCMGWGLSLDPNSALFQ